MDFSIDYFPEAKTHVLFYDQGGRRPATMTEIKMWELFKQIKESWEAGLQPHEDPTVYAKLVTIVGGK